MRLFLLGAVVAVAGVTGLLMYDGERQRAGSGAAGASERSEPTRPREAQAPEPLPGLDDPARFVAACGARGQGAVPHLLERLRGGGDRVLRPRWSFRDGRLDGFPTARAVYLEALRAIAGEEATAALAEVLSATDSLEETYLICLALAERRDRDWIVICLDRAGAEPTARTLPVLGGMVELAARTDPDEACAHLVRRAPRGESSTDPRALARVLGVVPVAHATAAATTLLEDRKVTPRAKSRYLRTLCSRPELAVVTALKKVVERGGLSERERVELAYAGAGGEGFLEDATAYQRALARGDGNAADAARGRFLRRMSEVKSLAGSALGVDLAASPDPKAAALRRLLAKQRKLLGGR